MVGAGVECRMERKKTMRTTYNLLFYIQACRITHLIARSVNDVNDDYHNKDVAIITEPQPHLQPRAW